MLSDTIFFCEFQRKQNFEIFQKFIAANEPCSPSHNETIKRASFPIQVWNSTHRHQRLPLAKYINKL